jgi:UDP-GlcNAc:undecaprenyl-phosphate GlcNAc-1-phosphate transferase
MLTPWVRSWALRRGAVDVPGGRRVNTLPTPRLGGVSVIAGFFVPIALFALVGTGAMQGFLAHPKLLWGLLFGGLLVGAVGAIDDLRGLGPWAKLGAQLAAASIAYAFGYRIDAINVPFVGDVSTGIASPVLTVLWFLAVTNAINLIDGLDGLASGIALVASVSNICLGFMNHSPLSVIMSTSLSGALLGFLRYNFNPATIFLGDAGSMFIGFMLAALAITGATTKSSTAIALLAPMIALGVPITDTLLAMIRRTVARQSIFLADRGHIHHRLLDLGITHRRVVLLLCSSSIVLATAALGTAFGHAWESGTALLVAAGVLLTLVRAARKRQPKLVSSEADASLTAASEPPQLLRAEPR